MRERERERGERKKEGAKCIATQHSDLPLQHVSMCVCVRKREGGTVRERKRERQSLCGAVKQSCDDAVVAFAGVCA